jgi:hypothetical protein
MIRHAYRMRETMMVHVKGLCQDLPRRDKTVTLPDLAKWETPATGNPWKSTDPFAMDEIAAFLAEGTDRYPTAAGSSL